MDTYVDIGANVGVMAFTAAAAVGPQWRVVAFEPHPDNIRNFLSHAALRFVVSGELTFTDLAQADHHFQHSDE